MFLWGFFLFHIFLQLNNVRRCTTYRRFLPHIRIHSNGKSSRIKSMDLSYRPNSVVDMDKSVTSSERTQDSTLPSVTVSLPRPSVSSRTSIHIRPAKFYDIAVIVALRILVFFPTFQYDEHAKQNLIEKVRRRYMKGTTLLMAFTNETEERTGANSIGEELHGSNTTSYLPSSTMPTSSFPVLSPMARAVSRARMVGTCELNPFDFDGTLMGDVDATLPLQGDQQQHSHPSHSTHHHVISHERSATTAETNKKKRSNKWYFADLAIREDMRQRGIASSFLTYIHDTIVPHHRIDELYLHVEVNNTIAQSLYKKFGYETLNIQQPAYRNFTEQHLQRLASHYVMMRKEFVHSVQQ